MFYILHAMVLGTMKNIELRHDSRRKTTTIRDEHGDAHLKCLGTGTGHVLADWKDVFFAELVEEFRLEPDRPCELAFWGEQVDFEQLEDSKVDFDGSSADTVEITLVYKGVIAIPEAPPSIEPPPSKCRNCGFDLKPHWVKCPKCKTPVIVEIRKCRYCDESLEDWMDECPACGKSTAPEEEVEKPIEPAPPVVNPELEQHKAQIEEYLNNEEWDKVVIECTQAFKIAPDDAELFFGRGAAYFHQADWTTAIADLSQAIRIKTDSSTDSAAALYLRGLAYFHQDNNDEALKDISKAIKLDASQPDYYNLRGLIFIEKRDYENAISDFTKAIQLVPDCAEYFYQRSNAYYNRNNNKTALYDINKALALEASNSDYYNLRGQILGEQQDYEHAIADFTEAIKLLPDFVYAFFNRGIAYLSKGDYTTAITDFSEAIKRNPDDYKFYLQRGYAYYNSGNLDMASKDITMSLQKEPNADAFYWRASLYLEKNKMAYQSPDENTRKKVAFALLSDLDRAIQLDANDVRYYNFRSNVYYAIGNKDQSKTDYQKALSLAPTLDKTDFSISSDNSNCFITTATCAALGKPDDCVELNSFRRFRDNWLLRQMDGQTLVDEYYRTAPAIVAAIDRSPEKNAAYSSLWREYLAPCLHLIEAGRFSECKEMYRKMVVTLQNAWLQRI
jgi:tetratricopeptide (TPR) repeat protein